jgi:hypothetical protein
LLPSSLQTLRHSYLRQLTGPTTPEVLAAEAQSVRYWRSAALGYRERLVDGFYEVHGEFPEVCPPTQFPHLAALMHVAPKADKRREVVLIDRRHDQHLAAMRDEAEQSLARCGPNDVMARFQALAHVVAGHMGGALVRLLLLLLLLLLCCRLLLLPTHHKKRPPL